jgi:dCMP deaminase
MAEAWAGRSKANRKQVGAIIVKNAQIISDGYNGMPSGAEDDCCEFLEDGVVKTKSEVLHAESNAILKLAALGGVGSAGGTLYVTMSPCMSCSLLIIQAKLKRVVFREIYRDVSGIENCKKYGIIVDQLVGDLYE